MPQVKHQWRSLEELAQDARFLSRVEQEFPGLGVALAAPRDRREALTLMAASLALAGIGLGGCDGAPEGWLTSNAVTAVSPTTVRLPLVISMYLIS